MVEVKHKEKKWRFSIPEELLGESKPFEGVREGDFLAFCRDGNEIKIEPVPGDIITNSSKTAEVESTAFGGNFSMEAGNLIEYRAGKWLGTVELINLGGSFIRLDKQSTRIKGGYTPPGISVPRPVLGQLGIGEKEGNTIDFLIGNTVKDEKRSVWNSRILVLNSNTKCTGNFKRHTLTLRFGRKAYYISRGKLRGAFPLTDDTRVTFVKNVESGHGEEGQIYMLLATPPVLVHSLIFVSTPRGNPRLRVPEAVQDYMGARKGNIRFCRWGDSKNKLLIRGAGKVDNEIARGKVLEGLIVEIPPEVINLPEFSGLSWQEKVEALTKSLQELRQTR